MANMRNLPVYRKLPEICRMIAENQVVVLAAETGSGKTTVIPPALLRAGAKSVVITGPRRLGVQLCAEYVRSQAGYEEGDRTIAFQHRYENERTADTQLSYLTEGILLQELREDTTLSGYDVVIIDEVHERSVNCDMLLFYLKLALGYRDDLRVVIMSATIDAEETAAYFETDAIYTIAGRQYPVSVSYEPHTLKNHRDLFKRIAEVIYECAALEVEGDVLVFLPDEASIQQVKQLLKRQGYDRFQVFELMSAQSKDDRQAALGPCPVRKIILSTNVAETSVTLEGVVFVLDSCLIKQDYYVDAYLGGLAIVGHSKAGLNQRKGRAGRVRSGYCHRFITEQEFNVLPEYTVPQILRVPLADVLLGLYDRRFKFDDVRRMKLLTPPPEGRWDEARSLLVEFKYIDEQDAITERGKLILGLGIPPLFGRFIIAGEKLGCLAEMLLFVAALSQQNSPFLNVQNWDNGNEITAQRNEAFVDPSSDFLSFYRCFLLYMSHDHHERRHFGRTYGVNVRTMDDIHRDWQQLMDRMKRGGVEISSLEGSSYDEVKDELTYALLVSLRHHLSAYKLESGSECFTRDREGEPKAIMVFPGSFVRKASGVGLVYAYERESKRLYAHWCHHVPYPMVIETAVDYLTQQTTVLKTEISTEYFLNNITVYTRRHDHITENTPDAVRRMMFRAYGSYSYGASVVPRVDRILQQVRGTSLGDRLLDRLGAVFPDGELRMSFQTVSEQELQAVVDRFCEEQQQHMRAHSEFVEFERFCVGARSFVEEFGHFVSTREIVALCNMDVVTLSAATRAMESLEHALGVAYQKLPTQEEMAASRARMQRCAETGMQALVRLTQSCPLCGGATQYDKAKHSIFCDRVDIHHHAMVGHFTDPTDVIVEQITYTDRGAFCTNSTLLRNRVYRVSVPRQFLSEELGMERMRPIITTTVDRARAFTEEYGQYSHLCALAEQTEQLVRNGHRVLTFQKDNRGYFATEDSSIRLMPMSVPEGFSAECAYVCDVYKPSHVRVRESVVRSLVPQSDARERESLCNRLIEQYPEFSSQLKK